MTWSSSAAEFNLQYLEQGRIFTLAVTRAADQTVSGTKLQFRHTPDGDWYTVAQAGAIVSPGASANVHFFEFRCISPYMRLLFEGNAPYQITQVCAAESTF